MKARFLADVPFLYTDYGKCENKTKHSRETVKYGRETQTQEEYHEKIM